jgi:hypothetical protein
MLKATLNHGKRLAAQPGRKQQTASRPTAHGGSRTAPQKKNAKFGCSE